MISYLSWGWLFPPTPLPGFRALGASAFRNPEGQPGGAGRQKAARGASPPSSFPRSWPSCHRKVLGMAGGMAEDPQAELANIPRAKRQRPVWRSWYRRMGVGAGDLRTRRAAARDWLRYTLRMHPFIGIFWEIVGFAPNFPD